MKPRGPSLPPTVGIHHGGRHDLWRQAVVGDCRLFYLLGVLSKAGTRRRLKQTTEQGRKYLERTTIFRFEDRIVWQIADRAPRYLVGWSIQTLSRIGHTVVFSEPAEVHSALQDVINDQQGLNRPL
jgi:hypothetical protein